MDPKRVRETPAEMLRARRAATWERLGAGVMVLPAAPVRFSSRDTDLPYRADSELFYLTGIDEPAAVAVLSGGDAPSWTLFVPRRDPDAELWGGPRMGPEEAAERFAPDACYPREEMERRLPGILDEGDRVHYRLGSGEEVDRMVRDALGRARARGPRKGVGPRGIVDPGEILDELRLRKDAHEMGRLRDAAQLTMAGHRAAAAAVRPGAGEWMVQAELEAAFRRSGGGPGFGTIVGSGANACILHYRANDTRMVEGQLVLVDAGAELGLYNGDITRTYPVSGRFSSPQRHIYDLVDAARAAAVDAVRPGVTADSVHETAVRVLVEGLIELGVLKGDVTRLVADEAHKPFYPHQTSHWLGLDVHDPGDYARHGASRILEPGMVLTIEPGLYFPPGGPEEASAYAGIGVRIEDDVLVTEEGRENLTAALPTASHEVEALVLGVGGGG